jgi:spore coat polysaccharide biosynthesis protein SpsF (cytidylyltransferase family)
MTSTRLPGKVLADLGGRSVLGVLLERLARAKEVDATLVATSSNATDDPIARELSSAGVACIRGPLEDVLERIRQAADASAADAVTRITGDCPLLDPEVVDATIRRWRDGAEDYVANVIEPRTYPDGMDVEVISREAISDAAQRATTPDDREHVTTYIRRHAERYPQAALRLDPSRSDVRITLDTREDLAHLRRIVARVGTEANLGQILESLA